MDVLRAAIALCRPASLGLGGGSRKLADAKEGGLIRREIAAGDLVKTLTMIVFLANALAGDPGS